MEPTYEYVRGQGWVPSVGQIVTMECGTKVRLEIRDPRPGERKQQNRMPCHWVTDGKPNYKWTDYIRTCRYEWEHVWDVHEVADEDKLYVVLVPL